jgi:hypothetical protein
VKRRRVALAAALGVAAVVAVALVLLLRGGSAAPPPVVTATREVDVSRLPGAQSETAIAADPRRGNVLLAGSNDIRALRMAVYSSTDGGRHWTRGHLPDPRGVKPCAESDPTVAIDLRGRQYFGFLGLTCAFGRVRTASIYVATRPSASARWRTLRLPVERPAQLTADDHPTLLVDDGPTSPRRGRLYAAWTRFAVNRDAFSDPEGEGVQLVDAEAVVAHSDDGGAHWSKPTVLAHHGSALEVRLAASRSGEVYAVWRQQASDALFVAHSPDGSTFESRTFVAASVVPARHSCFRARARIPAQPRRCVSPNPTVSVSPDGKRVYVVYGSTSLFRSQSVYLAVFDAALRPLLGVGTPNQVDPAGDFGGPDAFLPTSAVDPSDGRLWVCYYRSGRGKARRTARFTCASSTDGGRSWTPPARVARVASDETLKRANRANGYGDYEAVVARGGRAQAIWTDGRDLRSRGEEIYTASVVAR